MARSRAEIQADIAVTRRLIEHRLDDLHPWWTFSALLTSRERSLA